MVYLSTAEGAVGPSVVPSDLLLLSAAPGLRPVRCNCSCSLYVSKARFHAVNFRYKVVKQLGDGTYGNVWKAINRQTNEVVSSIMQEPKIGSEQAGVVASPAPDEMQSIRKRCSTHIFVDIANRCQRVVIRTDSCRAGG
eukprot:GHRQ01023982.1.p1 GENE.GHRQ01023982.1~~GHRQ01023982.1.p1  ORF type:complete len:139 (+),score=16.29 GHRQ01023982.1:861-1277(+)